MRKRARILTICSTAAAIGILAAPQAFAAPFPPSSWTTTPSGAYAADAGTTTLTDNNGNQISCTQSTASGSLAASATGSPAQLGTIDQASFGGSCSGPLGSTWSVQTTTSPAWRIVGATYDPDVDSGLTAGRIDTISARITGNVPILGSCTFDVTGSVDATYHNSTGTLSVSPVSGSGNILTISNKTGGGCATVGDTATFVGNYSVDIGGASPQVVGNP
jgi:hypothetical protein